MKVLLHKDVPKLGYFGDVVDVSDGYARNYLLPQGVAIEPTQANIKEIEKERAQQADLRRLAREALLKVAEKVNEAQIEIKVKANEQGHLFGSVSKEDIAQALREQSFEIQTKQVMLKEHIRQLGTYDVKLHFAQDIEAEVKVSVIRPEDKQNEDESEPAPDAENE